jgi:hypothetical protein
MYMRPGEVSGARVYLIMVQVFDTINPVKVLKTLPRFCPYQDIVPNGTNAFVFNVCFVP